MWMIARGPGVFFKSVVIVVSDGQGRGLGPWWGPRELLWLILLALSGTPSLPFFPRPQPEPGVAMATSEEPISLVISMEQSVSWSCELTGKRSALLSPVSLQASPTSLRPFLKDSAAPPSR